MTALQGEAWSRFPAAAGLHICLTLLVWLLADRLAERQGRPAFLNPVVVTAAVIVAVLLATGESYERYFDGVRWLHALLGPTTIALALPLYAYRHQITRHGLPIAAALFCGVTVAIAVAILVGRTLGATPASVLALAPRAATAPVAIAIADQIGAIASLAAVMTVVTGLFGAVFAIPLLRALHLDDDAAMGLAIGTISHGIGTARALQEGEQIGAFSALAMALAAPIAALLVPLAVSWLI